MMAATPPVAASAHARQLQNNHLHHRTSFAAPNAAAQKKRTPLVRRSTDKSAKTKRRSGEFHRGPNVAANDDDHDVANSFSQFCATCEVQIVVPSASILYCSEKCRRKDCGMSPPASPNLKDTSSAARPEDDVDIIPPLSPTIRKPSTFGTVGNSIDLGTSAKADSTRPSFDRRTSEAARYLGQFHAEQQPSRSSWRPRSSRHSAVPSLSHSPASTSSSSVPYTTTSHASRPLPMSRGLVSKSVDLVTPSAAASGEPSPDSMETLTAHATSLQLESRCALDDHDADDDGFFDDDEGFVHDTPSSYYEKQAYDERRISTAQSSLKSLLHPGGGRDKS